MGSNPTVSICLEYWEFKISIETESEEWEVYVQVLRSHYDTSDKDDPSPKGFGWEPFTGHSATVWDTIFWRRRKISLPIVHKIKQD